MKTMFTGKICEQNNIWSVYKGFLSCIGGGGGFTLLSFFLFTPAKNMKLSHGELHKTDESFPVLYS